MNVASSWKLTHDPEGDPLVLVNYGQEINEELGWTLERACEVVPLTDSDDPFLNPDGNALYPLEIYVFSDVATDKASRFAMMQGLISYRDLPKEPLRVEIDGYLDGRYHQFGASWIKIYAPRHLVEFAGRYGKKLSIIATKLTYTPGT